MNGHQRALPFDPAVAVARGQEDVVVGELIVRHRLASRVIHWTTALFFFVCVFTGMPIWSPIFGWMAHLFGGLAVCRWLHAWSGVAYFVAAFVMFVHWRRDMLLERSERAWLGPKVFQYLRYQDHDQDVGKYNGGQKLFFWAVSIGALGMLATGVVLWFPYEYAQLVRVLSILVHDIGFILFMLAIVFHIYLGTAAEPGTFGSMTRGTVTKAWARLHHPRWYRELAREDERARQ